MSVPQTEIALVLLAGVTSHPHGTAIQKLAHGDVFDLFDGQIEVFHRCAAHNVSQIPDGICCAIWVRFSGIVYQANEFIQVGHNIFLGELLGCHGSVAPELAVSIIPLPVELFRRRPQVYCQNLVDHLESIQLRLPHGFQSGFRFVEVANFHRALSHLIIEIGVHLVSGARTLSLRHRGFGNDPVFFHQVHEHIPLACVLNGR